MNNVFALGLFILLSAFNLVSAQTKQERDNRAIYNRIEFFFNTQQTDSIYQLANDDFKQRVSLDRLQGVFGYFYPFGRIVDTQVINFNNNTGEYEAKIGNKMALIKLSIDSNYKYSSLQIEEIHQTMVKKEPVISKVKTVDPLDFLVDSIARTYIQQMHAQSLAIGVIANNKVNMFFYGETEKESQTVPSENTIYEVGSLTKVFTATLLAHLVENNVVQLDDSIARYLPDSVKVNPFIQKITFKSLANHTSGLPRLPENLQNATNYRSTDPFATYAQKELYAFLKDFKSDRAPGEEYEYSDLGYGVLTDLLCTITNKTYEQLLKDEITTPLGLTNTVLTINPKSQQLIKVYNTQGIETSPWTFQTFSGAGGLRSTLKDLLSYAKIQFQMPSNTLENAMAQTRLFTYFLPPNTDIGLAWHMQMLDDIVLYAHSGSTTGSSSFIGLAPDKKSAIVVLSNSGISVDDISKKILEKVISTRVQ